MLHICNEIIDNQIFVLTDLGEIRNHDLCMDADKPNGKVKTFKCHQMGGNQKWKYNADVSSVIGYRNVSFSLNLFIDFFFVTGQNFPTFFRFMLATRHTKGTMGQCKTLSNRK